MCGESGDAQIWTEPSEKRMSIVYRIIGSTVISNVFHLFWLAVFLSTRHISNDTLPKAKWIRAFITNSARILLWLLVVYTLGTTVVYPYGAMMASNE